MLSIEENLAYSIIIDSSNQHVLLRSDFSVPSAIKVYMFNIGFFTKAQTMKQALLL